MYKIFSTGLFETCFYLISIFGCPSNSQYWTFLSKFWKELDRDCFLCFHFLTLFSSSTLIGFALEAAVGSISISMFREELNYSINFYFDLLKNETINVILGNWQKSLWSPPFLCLLSFHLCCLSGFQGRPLPWDICTLHIGVLTPLLGSYWPKRLYALGGYSLPHTKLSKVKWWF